MHLKWHKMGTNKKHAKRCDIFIQAGNNVIETVPNE